MMFRLVAATLSSSVLVACAPSSATLPAGKPLVRLDLPVADARVAAAWQLPDDLHLSMYGPERSGDFVGFGLDPSADADRNPVGTRGRYGVIDLRTGRLRFLQGVLDGGSTGDLISGLGQFLRIEVRPLRGGCEFGPGNCLEWAIVDTALPSMATRIVDHGTASSESVMVPRPVAGGRSFAWQRPLPDGSNEIVEWAPGTPAPVVIGRAKSEGVLVDSAAGWLLATMWGRGPTLALVTSGERVVAPPLEDLIAGPGGLVWAVQIPHTALDRPGTADVFVGEVRDGRLTGHKVARVSDVYGLGWAGPHHVMVGTPLGVSLVPVDGGSIIPLPAVPNVTARADGDSAVLIVPADRGGVGIAVIRAA